MKPKVNDIKRFLASLDRDQLSEIRSYIDDLLDKLRAINRTEPSKRPHVAMHERRQGDRYELNVIGECWNALCDSPADQERFPMRIADISHGGCRVFCNSTFSPGELVLLHFRVPTGDEQRIFVEIARSDEIKGVEGWRYAMGCRTIAEDQVEEAEKDLARQKAARKRLGFHPGVRAVLLLKGPGSTRAEKWIRAQEYNLATISSADEMSSCVESHRAHLILVSLESLQRGKTKWLHALLQNSPEVAVVVIVPSAKECARARMGKGVDQVVRALKIEEDLPAAIERALMGKLIWHDRKMAKYSVKVLVAGPEEKQLRRLETLLLQEDYLIAKSLSHEDMLKQLACQKIDILIADVTLLEHEGENRIAAIREEYPDLVIIAETDNSKRAEACMERDADLVLSPNASRSELLERLEEAYRILLRRTFAR